MPERRDQLLALREQSGNKGKFLAALERTRGTSRGFEMSPFVEEGRPDNRLAQSMEWLFNEKNRDEHAQVRRNVEAGMNHLVGVPIHAVIGIIDGIVDASTVLIGEMAEDVAHLFSYTGGRIADGWRRGRQGGTGR